MTKQMQQQMPAHLRKYVAPGGGGYVPQQAQNAISSYMQKSMPTHLKQYSGAYMQQKVLQPSAAAPAPQALKARAPIPDRLKLSHGGDVAAAQYDAQFHDQLFMPDAPAPNPASQPQMSTYETTPETQPPSYDFIMEPPAAPKPSRLPGGNSLLGRAVVSFVGVLILLMLFSVVKGVVNSGSNKPQLTSVAQDQTEIIHLAASAVQQQSESQLNLSAASQNFAVTSQASVTTARQVLLTYMSANHKKANKKELTLKINRAVDSQLTAAAAAGTYDPTFKQIMQSELQTYKQDLSRAYDATKGSKGRKLLTDDFNYAQLLETQLTTPAS